MWHIHTTIIAMKMQQCTPISIVVQIQNMAYCLHFLSCHNSITPFRLTRFIMWKLYVTVNYINTLALRLSVSIKIQY